MCGIFGVSLPANSGVSAGAFEALCNKLLLQSESRGKEAAGIALIQPDQLTVYKRPVGASELIRDADYKRLFASLSDSNARDSVERPVTVIGHARMVTDGFRTSNKNNQPVVKGDCAAIHNGIIVNVDELWNEFPQIEKQFELDSEVIPSLIQMFRNQGMSLIEATCSMFSSIKGMASISVLFDDLDYMLLATNNGSLYVAANEAGTVSLFASEKIIITQALARHSTVDWMRGYQVEHLEANNGQIIKLSDLSVQSFSFQEKQFPPFEEPGIKRPIEVLPLSQNTNGVSNFLPDKPLAKEFISHFEKCDRWIESLKRCIKCILPETMPFIDLDEEGVCSYCRNHRQIEAKGHEALAQAVAPYRSQTGEPDCIVNLSGGRDSCYGLHYVRDVLGLTPLAFTYDWGMVADLARRNISRLCSKLGVEHILLSADIVRKRENVRKNLRAWLKKPDLGMIPLLMAGDKQYLYHSLSLRRKYKLGLVITCVNSLEKTHFKSGFCGVEEGFGPNHPYRIPLSEKLKIAWYYLSRFVRNPDYMNASLGDTLTAFLSSYGMSHDFLFLYDYVRWDEGDIVSTLLREYDWEVAADTSGTWRIGDATSAFYNYIYYTVAGFSEIETFLSNQIREGPITRDEALSVAREKNRPRFQSIKWYLDTIGMGSDFEDVLHTINGIPRRYPCASGGGSPRD